MKVIKNKVTPAKPSVDINKRVVTLSAASLATHEAMQELIKQVMANQQSRPSEWKFTVHRDKNGFIKTVDAVART